MASAWAMMSNDINGATNKILICGAFFFYLVASLYSQISTGWAHDPSLRASWSRGSDYDAIYWLNFAINLAGALILGSVLVVLLLAA